MQLPPTIWDQMTKLTVLVIGDVMVDKYIRGTIDRISPEAPVPVVRVNEYDARLGGAANVALNIHALGAKAVLCAVAGSDSAGETLIAQMNHYNLPTSGIVRLNNRPTTTKTRIISGHQHIVRIDEEFDAPLEQNAEQEVLEKIIELLPEMDVIIFEDYDKGVITPRIIATVVSLAREHDIPVIVDPKKRNFLDYAGVSLFKPNLKELQEGLNMSVDKSDIKSIQEAVDKVRDELSCTAVLLTLSEFGVYADNGRDKLHLPAHVREIADVSGAGDSVISVAALAYALKLPLATIAELANLAGGLVCEHSGVVPIDLASLKKESEGLTEDHA